MSAERGREAFVAKGCVICHSVNGVGGEYAPRLDAAVTQGFVNPFDFVGRMWQGAEAMVKLQGEMLGGQLMFSGQELADVIAFVYDEEEQAKLKESDLPPRIRELVQSWNQ